MYQGVLKRLDLSERHLLAIALYVFMFSDAKAEACQ